MPVVFHIALVAAPPIALLSKILDSLVQMVWSAPALTVARELIVIKIESLTDLQSPAGSSDLYLT